MATRNSGRRGFASMDPEERRQIARRGGQASHGGRGYQEEDYDEDYEEDEDYDDYDEHKKSKVKMKVHLS